MSYHPVKCDLSSQALKKLSRGEGVAFHKDKVGHGHHEIHLTKTQYHRLSKGKGIRLRFSGAQVKHNLKHGKGFGDFLKSAAKSAGSYVAGKAADAAGNLLGNAAKGALGSIPIVGKPLGYLADKGIRAGTSALGNAAQGAINGSGIKKPRKKRVSKKGKGLAEIAVRPPRTHLRGEGLYLPGYSGGGLLPPPVKGANSGAAGI